MNRIPLRALALLLAWLTVTPSAFAQAPEPGSCLVGTSEKDLDINDVKARLFNTGTLFYGTSSEGIYQVPQSGGVAAIYATGIWIGGEVDDELRIAGATYGDYEFFPGPLGDDGRPVDPNDCSQFDRIWSVTRGDILSYEGGSSPTADLASWPVELGAPVIAAPNNGADDDGDGIVDEGTNEIDDDNDGLIDERDEQERVTAEGSRGLVYDLAAGDRPDIIGDQGLWWIMNDSGNTHRNLGTPPIGVEVRVLAWAFSRADELGQTTFYRYSVTNRSSDTLENTFLSIFVDPDLGEFQDDFVGSDPESGLGFVYNAADVDPQYGVPPAAGFDFFQGPIVDGDTLGTSSFAYFQNCSGDPFCDPQDAESYYNYMQGFWGDGTQLFAQGDGYQTDGEVTKFAFPGDPVTGEFWSEENNDGEGTSNTPSDRRFLLSTGPFELEPNVEQDIVFGIVFGQGSDRLNSISVLRAADELAQTAYDIDFELPSPPPAPPACVANSESLTPGSGRCAEAIAQDEAATLVWGYPTNSPNYLGAYTALDQLVAIDPDADALYEFEGFNIYRYPTSSFAQGEIIATYDKVNNVTRVIDEVTDPITGRPSFFVAAEGTNSGLRYTLTVEGLTNYTDYYYGITAYAFNEASIPKVLESSPTKLTVRPGLLTAGGGGTILNADRGDILVGTRTQGDGIAGLVARVVDPTQLMDAAYTVEFTEVDEDGDDETPAVRTYTIRRDGTVLFDGPAQIVNGIITGFDSQNLVIDGLQFFERRFDITGDLDEKPDFSGASADGPGADGIVEIAYPGFEDTCPDTEDPDDPGCEFFEIGNSVFLTGNVNNDYFIGTANASGVQQIRRDVVTLAPNDAELRFTDGTSYGLDFGTPSPEQLVWSVPFELWHIGTTPDDTSDDIRMIPFIIHEDGSPYTWENSFPRVDPSRPNDELPATNRVYWMMPDRANGYDLFAAAAATAGVGNAYVDTDVTDTPIDPSNYFVGDIRADNGDVCPNAGNYVSYCYRNDLTTDLPGARAVGGTFNYPIGRMTVVDLAGDGTTPPTGTTVRFITTKGALLTDGDVFTFDTSALVASRNDGVTAEEALDLIAAVPNPYLGTSSYESDNTDRVIRFTNIPDVATLRIFTVNGSLVRRINKDGPSRSIDWDLTTENNLPVASGMYLVHVEVPNVGDRVLKVGVINRQTDVTVF